MKTRIGLIVLCLLQLSCGKLSQSHDPFKIIILKSNSSMAYSNKVTVTDSLIQMTYIGGLVGERPNIIWNRAISGTFIDTIYTFLRTEPLDSLKSRYSDDSIIDGMQYLFVINYQGKFKKVQLDNVWLPQLLKLTQIVNTSLPDSLRFNLVIPKIFNAP